MISQLRLILSSSPFVSLKKRPSPATTAASYYVLAVRRQWLSGNIGHYVSLQCTLCVRGWNTLCSSSIHIKDMRQPPKGHFTSHALNSHSGFQSSAPAPPPPTLTSIPNTVKSFRLVMVNYKILNALVLFYSTCIWDQTLLSCTEMLLRKSSSSTHICIYFYNYNEYLTSDSRMYQAFM